MIILRNKRNGELKEIALTFEQYEKLKDCLDTRFECISCQLHNTDDNTKEAIKQGNKLFHNKFTHIGIHFLVSLSLFSLPFLLPHLHVDPNALLGASTLWSGTYSTYFAFRLDKEGLKVQ